ncbi:hypothetical protein BCR33DRAFT_497613 [Rhizoclosmatium globosum]|uniref:Dynactin subunit 4 n=1 Tax=Rhizoclosmatium globosum TaxID=329046 RepID=A0A1Y2CV10_9FUNG|nr:hypothetical protein BCR33DRAFT_497613 [Rhizoclosmatium globosum]|eukprot:ORY50881.1 hypothetical protein BCR33DRAFT_497613 [Rhizoclosmatium globosum]
MLPLSSGSVVYQCHCSGPEFNECNESSGPLFPLPSLLFCTSTTCKAAIKCGRCTTAEFASFFCANCLFEMPSASVKAERNRCARNCFECPTCLNTLTVVSALDGGAVHYLACGVCRWESVEVGIKFDRPTGLLCKCKRRMKIAGRARVCQPQILL